MTRREIENASNDRRGKSLQNGFPFKLIGLSGDSKIPSFVNFTHWHFFLFLQLFIFARSISLSHINIVWFCSRLPLSLSSCKRTHVSIDKPSGINKDVNFMLILRYEYLLNCVMIDIKNGLSMIDNCVIFAILLCACVCIFCYIIFYSVSMIGVGLWKTKCFDVSLRLCIRLLFPSGQLVRFPSFSKIASFPFIHFQVKYSVQRTWYIP